MRVVVSGASGMIGSALVRSLERAGHQVARLVRQNVPARADDIAWDPEHGVLDPAQLSGRDAVVHLAGENVAQRWSSAAKVRILESRVSGTELIASTMARAAAPPPVLVSASAIGIYGSHPPGMVSESSPPASDFLARVAQAWETAATAAAPAGIRVVHPRFGIVLSASGGLMRRLLPIFRLGAGGRLGSGEQWMSWVALDDVVRAIEFAIVTRSLAGPANVVSPHPVTNAEFTAALGRVLHRPTVLTVPAIALRLTMGEMADATALSSQRVVARTLPAAGFHFAHSDLEPTLRSLLTAGAG